MMAKEQKRSVQWAEYRCARPIISRSSNPACTARPVHTDVPFATFRAAANCDLFDHLVGASEQRRRYGEAQYLCRRQIDNEIELGWLLHRQVGRLRPAQDPRNPAKRWGEYATRLRAYCAVTVSLMIAEAARPCLSVMSSRNM